jgi:hypothetical protein
LLKCSQFSIATALAVLKILNLQNGREQIPDDDVAKINELLEIAGVLFVCEQDDGLTVRVKDSAEPSILIDQLNALE